LNYLVLGEDVSNKTPNHSLEQTRDSAGFA
jgi:hypothetical protein